MLSCVYRGSHTVQHYSGCKCNGKYNSCLWGGYIWVGKWIICTWNNWGEIPGRMKSMVRVLSSECKHYRNSEARKIPQGDQSKSRHFERDCKKPHFLSQVSAVNTVAAITLGKTEIKTVWYSTPVLEYSSTSHSRGEKSLGKEISHGLLKGLK